MPIVEARGTELFVERRGDAGDPLVLVHGSWVDHRTWNLILPKLARTFSVIVYDRRGHGRSAARSGPFHLEDDVTDLVALLETLNDYPAHVVGLSLGGSIGLRLAEKRPDLLRSLVVHEPPLYSLLGERSTERDAIMAEAAAVAARLARGDRRGAAQEFVDALAAEEGAWDRLGSAGQDLLLAHAERWLEEYRTPDTFRIDPAGLADFYAPTLLTNGALGRPIYAEILDRLAEALPNAIRQRIPGVGHLPHLTDPDQFVGVLLSFCAERQVPPT